MRTDPDLVLAVWCRLTGRVPEEVDEAERDEFLASPLMAELSTASYPALLEAGISAANRGSLLLPDWLGNLRALASRDDKRQASVPA